MITAPRVVAGARIAFTGRAEGDLGHGGAFVHEVDLAVAARRGAVCELPWTWLRQVHGATVVEVRAPGDRAGERADAAVTATAGCALAILTADCAPVALVAPDEGVLGAVHVGWRGLLAGVVEATTAAMRALGAGTVVAVIGPCIRPECYAFGDEDLQRVVSYAGNDVRARTAAGAPALDLAAGLRAVLARVGVDDVTDVGACTACTPGYFSHRARQERQRQALVLWR